MFTTYDDLKLPLPLEAGSATWTAVELEMNVPWLVARWRDEGNNVHRTFLLPDADEVVAFASQRILGRLTQLRLVLPPAWSASGDWELLRIARVEKVLAPNGKSRSTTLVVSEDGKRYGGFPVEPVGCGKEAAVTLFELGNA